MASISQQPDDVPVAGSSPTSSSSSTLDPTVTVTDSWRKDFLQSNFFSRKRSESVEDIPSAAHQISQSMPTNGPPLIGSAVATGGTWKMIKGRVSQAMGDIKSSKPDNVAKKASPDGGESDDDAVDDRSESGNDSDSENHQRKTSGDASFYSRLSSAKKRLSKIKANKSVESGRDVVRDSFEREGSPLRSSLLFKKKMRASPPSSIAQATSSPSRNVSTVDTSSMGREPSLPGTPNELRRRITQRSDVDYELPHDVEIESGIEITEEMMLNISNRTEHSVADGMHNNTTPVQNDIQWESDEPAPRHAIVKFLLIAWHVSLMLIKSVRFTCFCIFLLNGFALSEFLQGFLCSACIALDLVFLMKQHYGKYHLKDKIYSAELLGWKKGATHECSKVNKSAGATKLDQREQADRVLSYAGWMTEIKSYDPITFHLSMTRTVYVKLDGSKLRLSSYLRRSGSSERIPKRAHYNETSTVGLDVENDTDSESTRKKISLTNHRYYDLTGCDIKMLPLGIARKR